jgi:hypothetical protein
MYPAPQKNFMPQINPIQKPQIPSEQRLQINSKTESMQEKNLSIAMNFLTMLFKVSNLNTIYFTGLTMSIGVWA